MDFLGLSPYDGDEIYSITCQVCRARVVSGKGFAGESKIEAQERINQFKDLAKITKNKEEVD